MREARDVGGDMIGSIGNVYGAFGKVVGVRSGANAMRGWVEGCAGYWQQEEKDEKEGEGGGPGSVTR